MFETIFRVFSRRQAPDAPTPAALTGEFRFRALKRLADYFGPQAGDVFAGVHQKMTYNLGKPRLTAGRFCHSELHDLQAFLQDCADEHFLDALEFVLAEESITSDAEREIVDDLNRALDLDGLPYSITYTQWREFETDFHGQPTRAFEVIRRPQVIRKDHEYLHQTAIEPALTLLRQPDLRNANEEFLRALEDYRHGRYKECAEKCCSAFESVLKVICERRGYAYSDRDTASKLLQTVLPMTDLPSWWEQPLILIATIRNRITYAHGAGTTSKEMSAHVAKYSINATASAIVLICDEAY